MSTEAEGSAAQVVTDNPQRERYELRVDGSLVGVADYRRSDDTMIFTHTEVDPKLRGRGLAAVLVAAALEASASAGLTVEATCSYVRDYIDRRNSQRPASVDRES